MSCDLTATGAFKRMSGLWMPSDTRTNSTRNQYYQHDLIFRKESFPLIQQVGGGKAGNAPTESARILFWGNDHGCKVCDMNFASVAIQAGCANAGKLVLTTSPKDDFSEGYFVAVEATATQIPIDALTGGAWGYSGTNFTYGSMPGYATDRAYKRAYSAAGINESSTYINTPWPSANVIDYAVNFQGYKPPEYSLYFSTYAQYAVSTMPNLGGNYTESNISTLTRMRGGGNAAGINDGSQLLTFTKYIITCGTVSGGSSSTISTRAVWSGIDQSNEDRTSMWLGIAEGAIATGLGRYVFMPSMPITPLMQDNWRQGETFWKVDATPGTLVVVATETATTQQTAGLAAVSASGMKCLGTAVTASPKSASKRSSLVSSPLGLIWGADYVFPGINEAHTTKASKWPETVWPMEQPEQPVSLSIGSTKAKPTSLTVIFATTTAITTSYNSPATDALITTDMLDKPIATITPIVVDDETGKIGRDFVGNAIYGGITTVDYTDTPTKTEWQGVLGYELQHLEDTKTTTGDAYGPAKAYIDDGAYWYGASGQTQTWNTKRTEDYEFTVENIRARTNGKAFWDGEYTATNTTPDGTQSADDFFYAAPDRSSDVLEAVPTMNLPAIANRSAADAKAFLWTKPNEYFYINSSATYSISRLSNNIPSLAPYEQQIGRLYSAGGFGGSGAYAYDDSWNKTLKGFGVDNVEFGNKSSWDTVSYTHSATPTKFSVDVVKQRTQTLKQYVLWDTAVAEGWSQKDFSAPFTGYPTAKSEFYKADYARLDDLNSRLRNVSKLAMIKSCRWIPKQTQMFCLLKRGGAQGQGHTLPGGWGYYGGTVPDKDALAMLDQYSATNRANIYPSGGQLLVILRRSWQVELTVVTGKPTYTPCEVIADNLQRFNRLYINNFGGAAVVMSTFTGTRQVKFTMSFDIDQAESVTHKMNHESSAAVALPMDEQQFADFENGQEISLPVQGVFNNPFNSRSWGYYQGASAMYAQQTTSAKIKLN